MADLERSVLDFYQISTPYPDVWPAERDDADDNSDGFDGEPKASAAAAADRERRAKLNRRKSRYQALERAATHRGSALGGGGGGDKGLPRDEPDPLGTTDSVLLALKRNGAPGVQDEPRLRNRFLLSSTAFSPALFLSQVHTNASTETLLAGLDVLSRSIDQKSASLKVLVESNFERFVRAKATIDNVYKEMKYHGGEPPALPPRTHARTHSRQSSRSAFRNSLSAGPGALAAAAAAGAGVGAGDSNNGSGSPGVPDARKRNALLKESEYGVLGIKLPLLEVGAKAEDVWRPALSGREKEEALRVVSSTLARFHEYVEASAAIAESIKRNDHETLVEEYHRARRFADDARALVEQLQKQQQQQSRANNSRSKNGDSGGGGEEAAAAAAAEARPTDAQVYQILLAARMWHDVEEQIQAYKRDVWRRLTSMHSVARTADALAVAAAGGPHDQHMELIALLLELGVEDNPIWVWLLSRYDYLKSKIQATCERTKVEIEVLRRRLAAADKPAPHVIAGHLRALGRQSLESRKIATLDAGGVVELWEKVYGFLLQLLSAQGILGEVVEFWQTVGGFVDGRTQQSLPTGYRGESRAHHRLSQQGAVDLQKGAVELVDLLREHIFSFFAGPPPEDVSLLFSPIPLSPRTPRTPLSALSLHGAGGGEGGGGGGGWGGGGGGGPGTPLSPNGLRDPRFNLDPKNPPPPSPRRGEAWEKFAFWPPWSNSISGVHYLSKVLALVGSGASEMASLMDGAGGGGGGGGGGDAAATAGTDGGEVERLRTLVGAVRERCVAALCAAWNKDAETIKYVEDWHRAADRRDVTRMPAAFAAFEGAILSGMQKILYVSEAMSKPGAGAIVLPPPTKLLQMVRAQYVTTLYKALSGMVENAERPVKRADDEWTTATDGGGGGGGGDGRGAYGTAGATPASALALATVTPSALGDGRAAALLDNGAFNAGDRNVRMLLTLSNLQSLRTEMVPRLNTQFENAFAVKLTDETKTIRDVLGQIDSRLFLSYTRPTADALRRIVQDGLLGEAAATTTISADTDTDDAAVRQPRPYVYDALLLLVLVHAQVSTTAASLTQQVLSHLLEQLSRELLEAFKLRSAPYDLAALMQATLDVEFVAQTLSLYTTERAASLQSQIYQDLDARTDADARARLQSALPELRTVLKRLREASKNEFACFRKPKRAGGGAGGGGGGGGPGSERGDRGGGASSPAPSAGSGSGGGGGMGMAV